MSRFSLLAGSVALLAITGVNAGPCRPSSSVVSSRLEVATTSTEVAEPTTTLASTLTTETVMSETVSVTISTTEDLTAIETPTAQDTIALTEATTEGLTTTEAATTAEAATTTAETTTALATTSAAPVPVPVRNHECEDLVSPYMAPNGASFNFACDTSPDSYFPIDLYQVANFEQCLVQCSLNSNCRGVFWEQASLLCGAFSSADGTSSFPGADVAYKIEV